MYNRLLIAALATAFSINNFAAETPNYDKFPNQDARKYCSEFNTEACQSVLGFLIARESIDLTDEDKQQLENHIRSLHDEMVNAGVIKKSIIDATEQKTEEKGKEIAEELNIAQPQE